MGEEDYVVHLRVYQTLIAQLMVLEASPDDLKLELVVESCFTKKAS